MNMINYKSYVLIRDEIKNANNYLNFKTLNSKLSKKIDSTLIKETVNYLLHSNKIILSKDKKLIWVFADSKKSKKLLKESVKVA